ncbi:hypothetical protein HDV03_003838 [Kappamyces sp. JEL0829]|nr:hypothetical protein HDV03_003838 [Kappamyces sp. JEL0829]
MSNVSLATITERFLRLFYIVAPSKTTFASLDQVPDYISEAIPYFLATIGIEVAYYVFLDPAGLKAQRGKWTQGKLRLNDMIGSISAGSIQQLSRFFLPSVELSTYIWFYKHFNIVSLDPSLLSTWVVCFLTVDCGYYCLFWAFHSVHHSSEYYNQTTALRQSVLQQYSSWMFWLPGALFIPPPLFAAHKQLNTIYQYWIHTEIVPNLGFLEYIINTPASHRVHHGRNPYCIDKNYAGTLIIWDIIFGTYQKELVYPVVPKDKEEKVMYGVTHPINTFDPYRVQVDPLKHVASSFLQADGIKNKLKTLFYGPGWYIAPTGEETPRTGLLSDIPTISQTAPPHKYDPVIPAPITCYTLVQALTNVALVDFALGNRTAPKWFLQSIAAWVGLGYFSLGSILDASSLGLVAELVRVVGGGLLMNQIQRWALLPPLLCKLLQLSSWGGALFLMAYLALKGRTLSSKIKSE